MVIVVEGKNDKNKIESIFKNSFVLITNGSEINKDTINTIRELSKNNEIILCLDPDGPGERIRRKILEEVPSRKNVYAQKDKAISKNKRKVGIEHMSKEDILALFDNIYESKYEYNITYLDLYNLGLMNSRIKREKLCQKLNIGYCNAKQLVKRLNMLGIDINTVKENIYDC